jgi:hypothetical protein
VFGLLVDEFVEGGSNGFDVELWGWAKASWDAPSIKDRRTVKRDTVGGLFLGGIHHIERVDTSSDEGVDLIVEADANVKCLLRGRQDAGP